MIDVTDDQGGMCFLNLSLAIAFEISSLHSTGHGGGCIGFLIKATDDQCKSKPLSTIFLRLKRIKYLN